MVEPPNPAQRRRAYFHLQVAAQVWRTTADQLFLDAAGVSAAQAAVLLLVEADPGVSQRGLARTLRQRESAITAMATRLVDAGLLDRRRGADRRAWELRLTDAGRDALGALESAQRRLDSTLVDAVGADRVDALVDALEALSAAGPRPADPRT